MDTKCAFLERVDTWHVLIVGKLKAWHACWCALIKKCVCECESECVRVG
jgi:hypothetical protein